MIKDLRSIKSYNGNGLLPESINYSTIFGHDLPQSCGWYMRAEKTAFVPSSSGQCAAMTSLGPRPQPLRKRRVVRAPQVPGSAPRSESTQRAAPARTRGMMSSVRLA